MQELIKKKCVIWPHKQNGVDCFSVSLFIFLFPTKKARKLWTPSLACNIID